MFWNRGDGSRLSADQLAKLRVRLSRLDVAATPEEMDVPGFHFHPLKGERRGTYSVRVTGNFRLTFSWQGPDAVAVDLEDYH